MTNQNLRPSYARVSWRKRRRHSFSSSWLPSVLCATSKNTKVGGIKVFSGNIFLNFGNQKCTFGISHASVRLEVAKWVDNLQRVLSPSSGCSGKLKKIASWAAHFSPRKFGFKGLLWMLALNSLNILCALVHAHFRHYSLEKSIEYISGWRGIKTKYGLKNLHLPKILKVPSIFLQSCIPVPPQIVTSKSQVSIVHQVSDLGAIRSNVKLWSEQIFRYTCSASNGY